MVTIYVLKLQGNKYYVGKTTNPTYRLDDHIRFTGVRDGCIDDLYKTQINDLDDFNDYINLYEDKFMKYKYELQSKKTSELKEMCITSGLKRSGSKDDLINRLFVLRFDICLF